MTIKQALSKRSFNKYKNKNYYDLPQWMKSAIYKIMVISKFKHDYVYNPDCSKHLGE